MRFNVYRDGKMHVAARMCSTCIYRPEHRDIGERVIKEAGKRQTGVICHDTQFEKLNLVCRGFYDNDITTPLALARAMGIVEFTDRSSDD